MIKLTILERKVLPALEYKYFIKEGLIKSYPAETVKRLINSLPHFESVIPPAFSKYYIGYSNSLYVNIELIPDVDIINDILTSFIRILVSCGYYISVFDDGSKLNNSKMINDDNDYILDILTQQINDRIQKGKKKLQLAIEPKYDCEITIEQLPQYIYHATGSKYLEKIKKIGLSPKSQSKKSYHPERVYFGLTKDYTKNLGRMLESEIILEINTSGMTEPRYRFFIDPNSEEGIYTYSNIEPAKIKQL